MPESLLLLTTAFLVAGVFLLFLYMISRKARERFEKQFPPISDAEFMSRCRPGTNPEVALKVRRIVADNLGVQYERIYPSTRFVEDLGSD